MTPRPSSAARVSGRTLVTKDEAINALHQCQCGRWITGQDCDSCWVDAHRCPPTLADATEMLDRAIKIGREAESLRRKLHAAAS